MQNRIIIKLSLAILLWLGCSSAFALPPDWNEAEIQWHDYASGMAEAERTGKGVVLIFYAEWCPTCHAYKNIFKQPKVVELTRTLVMIRVDIDQQPALSEQYDFDGDYVPRTFALTATGEVRHNIYAKKRYRYFIKASDISTFSLLLEKAIKS